MNRYRLTILRNSGRATHALLDVPEGEQPMDLVDALRGLGYSDVSAVIAQPEHRGRLMDLSEEPVAENTEQGGSEPTIEILGETPPRLWVRIALVDLEGGVEFLNIVDVPVPVWEEAHAALSFFVDLEGDADDEDRAFDVGKLTEFLRKAGRIG